MSKIQLELELIERHVLILKEVMENEPIGILRLADKLKIPTHKVRYSLRMLEQEGLIKPTQNGAKITEKMKSYMPTVKSQLKGMSDRLAKIVSNLPP
ncbi:MAG: winged helix-turn-helix transcriptional regulator [Candidatus Thermoplasmatota archaeon]